jgi:hypothetical protein
MSKSNPKVVIDGNNVIHYSTTPSSPKKARIEQLLEVIKDLEQRGFDVIPLISAKTKYYIDKKGLLKKLLSQGAILEIPTGTDDDLYILETARKLQAKIVTNDLFRDYVKKFPEIYKERLPFMIVHDQLIIPDLN